MIPEAFAISLEAKIILSPSSIAMLVALGLCVAITWRFIKGKLK